MTDSPILSTSVNNQTCHAMTSFSVQVKAPQIVPEVEYCNGSKHTAGSNWTFQKHVFPITITLWFSDPNTKTINWELRNVTDNILIDSGSWQKVGSGYTSFSKTIETAQNHTNKQIRLLVSTTQNANIGVNLGIQCHYV